MKGGVYMELLIVIDMQNDFISGALGTPEAQSIVEGVCGTIRRFSGRVLATRDTHGADYLSTQEGRRLPVVHCVKGTPGWELEGSVAEACRERDAVIFDKPAFGSMELADYLTVLHAKTPLKRILLAGLCTDICVISNALLVKAALPEVPVAVDAACCAGVTPESHETALAAMRMCQIEILG